MEDEKFWVQLKQLNTLLFFKEVLKS